MGPLKFSLGIDTIIDCISEPKTLCTQNGFSQMYYSLLCSRRYVSRKVDKITVWMITSNFGWPLPYICIHGMTIKNASYGVVADIEYRSKLDTAYHILYRLFYICIILLMAKHDLGSDFMFVRFYDWFKLQAKFQNQNRPQISQSYKSQWDIFPFIGSPSHICSFKWTNMLIALSSCNLFK